MALSDSLVRHLRDTTSQLGKSTSTRKVAKTRQTALSVIAAIIFGAIFSFAQMHQRDKSDAKAVKEGKIPAVTLSVK